MSESREQRIRQQLEENFHPRELLVRDQSHLHAGHEGARDGRGHFEVTIVSDAFAGVGKVQRHRMVFAALGSLLETDIHAVRIKAFAPGER